MYYSGVSLAHYQHLSSLKLPLHQGVNFLCPASQEISAQITSALALPNNLFAVNLADPTCWSSQLIIKLNELALYNASDKAILSELSNLGPSITLWLCPEQGCMPKTVVIHLALSIAYLPKIPPALFQEGGQITVESSTKPVVLSQAAQRRLNNLKLKTKVSLGELAWFDESTSKVLQGYLLCLAHSSLGSYPKLGSQDSQFSQEQALSLLREYLTTSEINKIQDLLLSLPDLNYSTYDELAGQLYNVQELIYSDQIASIRDY